MPIYEYHCSSCQKTHEILQKVSDPRLAICPACGGKLDKKISLSAFQLKGSGWYKDGYATPPPKQETQPKSEEKKGPEKKEDKKESKPPKEAP